MSDLTSDQSKNVDIDKAIDALDRGAMRSRLRDRIRISLAFAAVLLVVLSVFAVYMERRTDAKTSQIASQQVKISQKESVIAAKQQATAVRVTTIQERDDRQLLSFFCAEFDENDEYRASLHRIDQRYPRFDARQAALREALFQKQLRLADQRRAACAALNKTL